MNTDELKRTIDGYFSEQNAHNQQKLEHAENSLEVEFYRGYLNALAEIRSDIRNFISANVEATQP